MDYLQRSSSDLGIWQLLVAGADPNTEKDAEVVIPPGDRFEVHHDIVRAGATAMVATALRAAGQFGSKRSRCDPPNLNWDEVRSAVLSERYFSTTEGDGGVGFAPLSRFWQTSNGWFRTHANYPWHRRALFDALGVDDEEEVGAAIAARGGNELEESLFDHGGVGAVVRSPQEWSSHPQGRALAEFPLVEISEYPAGISYRSRGTLPDLSDLKVLDLTRVIAGPVCTRFLGALGASVLRLDPPHLMDLVPMQMADTLLGKMSAPCDLRVAGSLDRVHELLGEADIVVVGYRPGSLDRFGLSPWQLVERYEGLVVISLSAWGRVGPWGSRRGFDSIVQGASGIADLLQSDDGHPGVLPAQLLDHGTGYLAAAAALEGIRRRGGTASSVIGEVSLARTAMWMMSLATSEDLELSTQAWEVDPLTIQRFVDQSGVEVSAVGPPGTLGGKKLQWSSPPSRYLGSGMCWPAKYSEMV